MDAILRFFQALCLVLWLGGMIFFGLVVAPSAFAVLPTRQLAGTLVGTTLFKLNYLSCILLAVFLLLTLVASALGSRPRKVRRHILAAAAAVALALSLYAWGGVDRRMHALRTRMDAVETSVAEDPTRAEFDRLHRRSVAFFGVNVVLGLLMLGLWTREIGRPQ
ncbi:MAG: DUF4149 domain-containing protein [Acidobacteriia bacterium]|nr:DUF4149 domain-containing protein [Terriglobia bacterium]